MRFLLLSVCAVLLVGLLAAGCTTPAPAPVPAPVSPAVTAAPLADPALSGYWILKGVVLGGTPVIPNYQATLVIKNDGSLSGFGGCNNFQGSYVLTGTTTEFGKSIAIGPLASTLKYCENSDAESRYFALLQSVNTYSISNDNLLFRNSEQSQVSFRKGTP